MNDYTGIICPHCGHETGIEPALVNPDDPMIYCPECDEPLFQIGEINILDNTKAVFTTHVDNRGRLNASKERFECPHCTGEAYIKNSVVLPNGYQHFEFVCTDCAEEWPESY